MPKEKTNATTPRCCHWSIIAIQLEFPLFYPAIILGYTFTSAVQGTFGRASAGIGAQRQAFMRPRMQGQAEHEWRRIWNKRKSPPWDKSDEMACQNTHAAGEATHQSLSLNRKTVRYMLDSTVNKALKVEKQFKEMEQERGFKMTEENRRRWKKLKISVWSTFGNWRMLPEGWGERTRSCSTC